MEAVSKRYPEREDYDDLSSFAPVEVHPHPEGSAGEPPKPGGWHPPAVAVVPQTRVRYRVSWLLSWIVLAGGLFGLILGAMAQSSAGVADDRLGLWYLGIAVLTVVVMLRLLSQLGNGTLAPPHVAALAQERGMLKALPTKVRIIADGKEIGEDEGLVRFEHGVLAFVGVCCEFAIGSQDIRLVSSCGQSVDFPIGLERSPRIALRHPERQLEVCFRPWSRLTPDDPRDCSYRFAHEFRRFVHAWRPGAGERRWPPTEPKPLDQPGGAELQLGASGA
ncbi:MAG: hypothetical protein ACK41F_04455 [Fimbriimonadaceae bacterium]